MSYIAILAVLIIVITSSLGFIVLASNWKNDQNRILFAVILLSALWIVSSFLADHASTSTTALFWVRVAIIPPAFVLPLFLYFSLIFPVRSLRRNSAKILLLFVPAVTYLLLAT